MSCSDLTLLVGSAWLLVASFTAWRRKLQAKRTMVAAAEEWGDRVIHCEVEIRPWWAWPFGGTVKVVALIEEADGALVTVCRMEER